MREMNKHWAEAWLGRPWIAGEHDCADFVAEVLRVEFGRALDLPARAESGSGAPTGATVRGWDRQIAILRRRIRVACRAGGATEL